MCPDFVIELRSTTDRKATLRDKMREWIENGTRLGWLIDPLDHTVEIYRSTGAGEMLVEPDCVKGEGPVEGFSLSLTRVWEDWPL
jgi:Uma2 family endonuclease